MKSQALDPQIYARTVAELKWLIERHGAAAIIATVKAVA